MNDECCVIPEKGVCPVCGKRGRATRRDVPSLHLKLEAIGKTTGWKEVSVCLNPDCEALYFEGGQWVLYADSKTRVGYKEKEAPHPLCYCFNHTGEEFLEQIRTQGKPVAVDKIKAEVKAGTCRCEITNPTGGCCLATINEFLKRNASTDVNNSSRVKTLNTKGSVKIKTLGIVSALAASACCVGPLLLAALGLGGLSLGRYLGAAHWYFTALGFALVGYGFLRYFKEKKSCDAHGCAMPGQKATLSVLIVATLFISGFTVWESGIFEKVQVDACCLINNAGTTHGDSTTLGSGTMKFSVTGMTCEACAHIVQTAVRKVPGVKNTRVNFKDGKAFVTADPKVKTEDIVQAVKKAGYGAQAQ